jgi:Na+-transporting NADH:ubiquinone oxidoreductase subunit A
VTTTPDASPKAIFVSALRDMPLAADFEFELSGNEKAFQTGLTALSKMAKTYLGIGAKQSADALVGASDVEVTVFDGPCPAGNVCVQVNHLNPVNKGEVVWTVDPTAVIFFGRLLLTGKVDLTRTVAVAGSEVKKPSYADVLVGTPLKAILDGQLESEQGMRIINGNPLTGVKASLDDFLGAHTSEVTVIPEGDNADELLGWILPRTKQFSVNRSYFSWLFGKKREYALDARVKGGERKIIMSGEYDRVLPMDIYGEYLIKAIIAEDIDRMEQLGIYEVSPEDFALAEFVDSSKLELQHIVRKGLDLLRKENA